MWIYVQTQTSEYVWEFKTNMVLAPVSCFCYVIVNRIPQNGCQHTRLRSSSATLFPSDYSSQLNIPMLLELVVCALFFLRLKVLCLHVLLNCIKCAFLVVHGLGTV